MIFDHSFLLINNFKKHSDYIEEGFFIVEMYARYVFFEIQSFCQPINFLNTNGCLRVIQTQMKISKIQIVTILVIAQLGLGIKIRATHYFQHQFCWKDSYGRGVGTIPDTCAPGQQKLVLLCYDQCPKGYKRFVFDCHQECPQGFVEIGLFCRKKDYGRGFGFLWKFRDGLNDSGMFSRCEAEHGKGNCEKTGLIVYPKCKPGFERFGCCICRPPKPDCKGLGMNGRFELSCVKKIQIGSPHGASCPPGKQNNAGLCYEPCRQGYKGVGPVCWGQPPKGWVGCGMGAAKSKRICRSIIVSQVASVGQMAISITSDVVTLGVSAGATATAKVAKNSSKIGKLKKQLQSIKKAVKTSKNVKKVSKAAKNAKKVKNYGDKLKQGLQKGVAAANAAEQLNELRSQKATPANIARVSASIAALADPTGIVETVVAYTHPKCSKIYKY